MHSLLELVVGGEVLEEYGDDDGVVVRLIVLVFIVVAVTKVLLV